MRRESFYCKLLEFYGTKINHPGHWRVHAALRRLVPIHIDEDVEVMRAGLKWVLNPADYTQQGFFWRGEKDTWEMYHIKRLLHADAVIFDVGANFGFYALMLAAMLEPRGRVYAFEPVPDTFARLQKNIELNGLQSAVQAFDMGLAEAARAGHMDYHAEHTGGARILDDGAAGTAVNLTSMDAFCAQDKIQRVDLIKLDVEGYEEKVLRGGADTLRRLQPILLIELSPTTQPRAGASMAGVVELLTSRGYEFYVARRKRLTRMKSLPRGLDHINAFALPRG